MKKLKVNAELVDDSSPLARTRNLTDSDRNRPTSEVKPSSARGVRSATLSTPKSRSPGDRIGRNSRPTSSVSRTTMKRTNKNSKELKKMDSNTSQSEDEHDPKEADVIDPKEKLMTCLVTCLADCSRQRLRAFHMTLSHCGNVDNKITVKELQTALQENQIHLTPRAWALVSELYDNPTGLDHESLYQCLAAAHLKTGRDSIKARSQRNDVEAKDVWSREAMHQDFVRRLEELLIKDHTFFDIPLLREECSKWDQHRVGKMDKEGALLICSEKTPLYGALLKNLLEYCDEDKDRKVSWPVLLSFMEKAQTQAWVKCPQLASLPDKAKEVAAIRIATPDPIDELSSSARSVMTKLLKRAQKKRGNSANSSPEAPLSRESTTVADVTSGGQSEGHLTVVVSQDNGKENGAKSASKDGVKNKPIMSSEDSTKDKKPGQGQNGKQTLQKYPQKLDSKKNTPKSLSGGPVKKKVTHKPIPGSDITLAVPQDFRLTDTTIDPPAERLQLEWIYGYRGKDCQRNLNLLASGELIYFMANTVILLDSLDNGASQRHYREHTEAIRCLALHSNGLFVATGQTSGKTPHADQAHVRLWRSDTLQTLHVLGDGTFVRTVTCLAFMPFEDILVSSDNAQEKKMTMWDTESGTVMAETFVNTEVLCDMTFNPKTTEILVTCGKEHLAWWKISKEARLIQASAQPNYELFLKARFIYCLIHTSKGDLVTGDSNGTVYVWGDGGNSITNFIKHGHDGPVLSLCHYKNTLITGGRDGCVRSWNWNKNMDCLTCLRLPSVEEGIRTLRVIPQANSNSNSSDLHPFLVLGTTMQGLFTGQLDVDKFEDMDCITQGHSDHVKGLHPLCQSPIGADVITTSCDGVVCKLNTKTREIIWRTVFKGFSFTCVDATPYGLDLTLGTKDGHLVLIQLQKEEMLPVIVFNKKVSSSPVNRVKMSPDMRMIAVAANDKTIHILSLQRKEGENGEESEEEEWRLQGRCWGHHSPVTAVDWSRERKDGSYLLRSCGSNPEQLFWNPHTCQPLEGDQVCDSTWATHSCLLDHSLIGLWSCTQAKNNHVIGGDVSVQRALVAMTTDNGFMSLFRYPCCSKAAFSHTYKAHQRTESLCFTTDGRSLITVGGADMSIMQWKLV